MQLGKKSPDNQDTPQEETLEQRVDAMMDIRAEASAAPVNPVEHTPEPMLVKPLVEDTPPEIDIFKDVKTAPLLGDNTGAPSSVPKTTETELHNEIVSETAQAEVPAGAAPTQDATKDAVHEAAVPHDIDITVDDAKDQQITVAHGANSPKHARSWRQRVRRFLWRGGVTQLHVGVQSSV